MKQSLQQNKMVYNFYFFFYLYLIDKNLNFFEISNVFYIDLYFGGGCVAVQSHWQSATLFQEFKTQEFSRDIISL